MSVNEIRIENLSSLYITTPMIENLHQRITQWTWCGAIGGCVIGEARSGKTFAVRSLANYIESRLGEKIPVLKIAYGHRDKKTVRGAFFKIALSLYGKVKKSNTSDDLSEMICEKLLDVASGNRTKQVILLVDEAQFLTIEQFSCFAEIHNMLVELNTNCLFLFVVNEDNFLSIAQQLQLSENSYITERFFTNIYHFYGIRSAQELKVCLEAYEDLIVDKDKPTTLMEKYHPKLHQSGWRLSSISDTYWFYFCERYKNPYKLKSFRMNQFARATNILILDYLPNIGGIGTETLIEAAVIKSLESASIIPDMIKICH